MEIQEIDYKMKNSVQLKTYEHYIYPTQQLELVQPTGASFGDGGFGTFAGQTIAGGEVVEFVIPERARCWIDGARSFLKFKFASRNSVNNNYYALETSAYDMIRKIEVLQGSRILESIDNFNIQQSLLMDWGINQEHRSSIYNVLALTQNTQSTGQAFAGSVTQIDATNDTQEIRKRAGAQMFNTELYSVALPLPSAIMGMYQKKNLCIDKLQEPLRIRFILESGVRAFVSTNGSGTASYTAGDFELNLQIVEMAESSFSLLKQHHGGKLNTVVDMWENKVSQLPKDISAGNTYTLQYNNSSSRYKSLKNLVWFPIHQLTGAQFLQISGRSILPIQSVKFGLSSGKELHRRPINCSYIQGLDAYMSMVKVFNLLGDHKTGGDTVMDLHNFYAIGSSQAPNMSGTSGNNTAILGGGSVGLCLKTYENNNAIFSGVDTSDSDLIIVEVQVIVTLSNQNTAYLMCNYDAILSYDMENGIYTLQK